MLVTQCLTMLGPKIAKLVVEGFQERVVCVLASDELSLLEQSLHLVQSNLALHKAYDDENVFVGTNSLHVKASYRAGLYFFVSQSCDLLLRVIVEANRTIRKTHCNKVFQSSYSVGNTLGHLSVTVKSVRDLFEKRLVHKLTSGLVLTTARRCHHIRLVTL